MKVDGIYMDEDLYSLCVQIIEAAKEALKRNGGKDIVFTCAYYKHFDRAKGNEEDRLD